MMMTTTASNIFDDVNGFGVKIELKKDEFRVERVVDDVSGKTVEYMSIDMSVEW